MTLENFKKAMERADLVLLKQTEKNLFSHIDDKRMAIVKEQIELRNKVETPKAEEPKKRSK